MAVYELLSSSDNYINAQRTHYDFNIDYLFAGPDLDKTNGGSASEEGRKGFVSRVNYNYKGKYLFEFDSRYDASSKFPKESRWGFFPSASVGWRISEENFMKNSLPVLNNLKIRASYGSLGYDNTSNYQYLATYSVTSQYIYDGSNNILSNGIKADALPNPNITWEKMTTKDIGLDFGIWSKYHFTDPFDYFYRLRSNVLGTRIQSIPNIAGANPCPRKITLNMIISGWEFVLTP